jgi:putative choline sulfate-utilization transcription factor
MPDIRRLPPLQSLIFFEAAGRHRNFSAAARELGTTQSAVSHQIHFLEQDLGTPLFHRLHRGVDLTADGNRLFECVRDGFDHLHRVVSEIRSRRRHQVLAVATDFGFAACWMMPRLGNLRALIPDLDVRIVTSQHWIDLRGEPLDVAVEIGGGPGHWPGCVAEPLFPESVVTVCSPGLLAFHGPIAGPGDLARLPLLHLESVKPARWLCWDDWFAAHGVARTGTGRDLTFNNYPLVLQAAVAGQGVALGWLPLVEDLLRGGQLVAVLDRTLRTDCSYYLVTPNRRDRPVVLDRFRTWILDECRRATTAWPPSPETR